MAEPGRGDPRGLPELRAPAGEAAGRLGEPTELWDDSGYVALYVALSLFLMAIFSLAASPLGTFLMVAFGCHVIYSGQRLLRRKPRLRITDEGLIDESFWYSPGFIPWENIVDISGAKLGLIDVELRDEATFFDGLSPLQVIPRVKWKLWGFGPAMITPWLLRGSREEVLDVLQAGLDAYTLRSGLSSPAFPEQPPTYPNAPWLPTTDPAPE